jgi:DNA-binding PadR family transcriptional regulator
MNIQSEIPLTEATFLILMSLINAPQHGYAIMKDVEQVSAGRVKFSTGTLYGALKRLLDQGWIARFDAVGTVETNRPRKMYRLTGIGEAILLAEVDRLESLSRLSRLRLNENLT